MRVLRRREFLLAIPLLALVSLPALPQNLLVNPGFDRDLSGWTAATSTFPSSDPGHVEASVAWGPVDSKGSAVSGGAALHARAETFSTASAFVEQCVPAVGGSLVTFGARFLTIRQLTTASGEVQVRFYPSTDCSGTSTGPAALAQLPSGGPLETNSGGRWDLASSSALVPAEARSTRIDVGVSATGTSFYGLSYVDAVADEAFLTAAAATEVVSILPSAAWISGVSAYWRTGMTLVNPGAADAAVALKWLGHDMDGRGGTERAYVVRAGQTLSLSDEEWELNHQQDYGAILMTSSSPSVFLQSETSTPAPSGGSVGQALPALGAADYAGATPKTLAPIRENGAFRTNLVLANPTEIPVMAHVALFAADGAPLGAQDVALPPLGMTQLTRAAALLGAPALNLGRISVSTPTAGGLVAAYASVIDNVTSDPRTLLPQDATPATPGTNLLTNPGFDRDLSSWTLTLSVPDSNASRSAVWVSDDAAGTSGSGSVALGAGSAGFGGYGWALIEQCASVVPGRTYGLRAKVRGSSWGWFYGSAPWPGLTSSFYESADCTGSAILRQSEGVNAFSSGDSSSWFSLALDAAAAPASARSARVDLSAAAGGDVHGSAIGAWFDDVVFSEGQSTWTSFVPAAASIRGMNGSRWTTTLTLSNAGSDDATVYVSGVATNVAAGATVTLPDVVHDTLGLDQTWLPLRILSTSPGVAVTAETSSPSGAGSVGQALAALTARDLAGATPKSIAPVRDDDAFRTNLVLANATSAPLVAHVDLFDGSGAALGSRDVPLDANAATQIDAVVWTLSGRSLDAGRLAISTPTPGGLVAAYASVIDNVTNDPRTLLPR